MSGTVKSPPSYISGICRHYTGSVLYLQTGGFSFLEENHCLAFLRFWYCLMDNIIHTITWVSPFCRQLNSKEVGSVFPSVSVPVQI